MKKRLAVLTMIFLLASQAIVSADDQDTAAPVEAKSTTSKVGDVVGKVLLLEVGVAAVSGLAAADPDLMGGAQVLLSPIAASGARSGSTAVVGIAGMAGLGLYNILKFDDDDSRGKIFTHNVVAYHVIFGALLVTDLLTPKPERVKADSAAANEPVYQLGVAPVAGGAIVSMGIRF